MASITGSISRPNLELPAVPQVKLAAVSVEGLKLFSSTGMALLTVFAPMLAMFFLARGTGISALCYDDLSRQAAMTGITLLPFSIYCIILSSRRSLRAVFKVTAMVSTVLGALLAAIV